MNLHIDPETEQKRLPVVNISFSSRVLMMTCVIALIVPVPFYEKWDMYIKALLAAVILSSLISIFNQFCSLLPHFVKAMEQINTSLRLKIKSDKDLQEEAFRRLPPDDEGGLGEPWKNPVDPKRF